MTQNVYEGMFLLDSSKTGGDWNQAQKTVQDILQRHKAVIIASRPWDERRLAYPIRGHKKGMYFLTYFRAEGPALAGIEGDCRISEVVMRQLVLKVHPKLVDQLVAHAMSAQQERPAESGDGQPAAAAAAEEEDG